MAIYLDTETTGFSPAKGARIVEIAIVDENGRALINTLINPMGRIPSQAMGVHGITDAMVALAPTIEQIMPEINRIVRGQTVVIYNKAFDVPFFPNRLSIAGSIHCAMLGFAFATGGKRVSLNKAAHMVGHQWRGEIHRAFADADACRAVWKWFNR